MSWRCGCPAQQVPWSQAESLHSLLNALLYLTTKECNRAPAEPVQPEGPSHAPWMSRLRRRSPKVLKSFLDAESCRLDWMELWIKRLSNFVKLFAHLASGSQSEVRIMGHPRVFSGVVLLQNCLWGHQSRRRYHPIGPISLLDLISICSIRATRLGGASRSQKRRGILHFRGLSKRRHGIHRNSDPKPLLQGSFQELVRLVIN